MSKDKVGPLFLVQLNFAVRSSVYPHISGVSKSHIFLLHAPSSKEISSRATVPFYVFTVQCRNVILKLRTITLFYVVSIFCFGTVIKKLHVEN